MPRAHEGLQRAVMYTAQWQLSKCTHPESPTRASRLRLCWCFSRYFVAASTQTTSLSVLSKLHPLKTYRVQFIDGGTVSTLSGKDLMEAGVFLSLPQPGASEIILVNEV